MAIMPDMLVDTIIYYSADRQTMATINHIIPPTTFDTRTDTIRYPDGVEETLVQYQTRKYKFEYIRGLQNALERMKVLYQNPGCLTEGGYNAAKDAIQEQFDYWEMNLFIEFGDK
jgi:hypothetical protein